MKFGVRIPARVGTYALATALMTAALLIPSGAGRAQTGATSVAADYAEQITRLVHDRKLDDLAMLAVPKTGETAKIEEWKGEYVTEMRKAEGFRTQHYNEEVTKAQDAQGNDRLMDAIGHTVQAYLLATDRDAFLSIPWVKQLTAKTAARALELETSGKWLESLQLFSDLNSLYEIDTRYKADMQRLAHRVRLLALYTPKTLYEMRKAALAAAEKSKAENKTSSVEISPPSTQPGEANKTTTATKPTADPQPPLFTRWQDHVEKITLKMARMALDETRRNWVERTNYETLLRGGVEALRLFLSTPELIQEFPALGNEQAKTEFASALNHALAQIHPNDVMDADTFHRILDDLIVADAKTIQLPEPVVLMEFTDGAMEKLDPFTTVIWPHGFADFDKSIRGTFGGVGIIITLDNDRQLKVISPLEDTPAYNAGIQAGDVITAIDGKSTLGISSDQAVTQITGEPDTKVTLTVKRDSDSLNFPLTRAVIHVSSVKGYKRDPSDPAKWLYMIDPENKIGYIRITGFQDDTCGELRKAITSLQEDGCKGIVLDLRFNPGGLLTAAIEMSGMFVNTPDPPYPTIVSVKGSSTPRQSQPARGKPFVPWSLPVVVVINQYSASASEIFSGAIKDLHRGLIVGQRSYGKGSVQNVVPLEQNGANTVAEIKLTVQYYYLPDGESLHRRDGEKKWGVEPDITVEMTRNQAQALADARYEADIISRAAANGETKKPTPPAADAAATQKAAATEPSEPLLDTQLNTALLMLRLQLIQPHT